MASGIDRFPSGSGGFAQVVKKSVTDLYLTVHDFGVQVDTFVFMPKGFAVRQLQIIRLEGPRARLRLRLRRRLRRRRWRAIAAIAIRSQWGGARRATPEGQAMKGPRSSLASDIYKFATARLTRPYLGLMAMTLAAHSMQISSSRRPVTGIPACTHGQGVLSLLYTGRDDAIVAFPNHFSISSSTRSV